MTIPTNLPSPASNAPPGQAVPAHTVAAIESPAPGRGRPVDGDNSTLYGVGGQIADRIALQIERGVEGRAALRRVAADLGLDVAEARPAVRFKEAVDRIAGNVGEGATEA